MSTVKIRFFPDKKAKLHFNQCCGADRYFYNQTIDMFNKQQIKTNFINYRNVIVKSKKNLKPSELWQTQISYNTRQLAVKEAITRIDTAFKLQKLRHVKKFKIKFRSRKNYHQGFNVDKQNIKIIRNRVSIFPTKSLKIRIVKKEFRKIQQIGIKNNKFIKSCKVQKIGKNTWYLIIPYERKKEKIVDRSTIISLDPGIRKFQSGFDSENQTFLKFGERSSGVIEKLSEKIDSLKSYRSKKQNRRRKIDLLCQKLRTKMKGKINNLHYQLRSYLTKNYETIVVSNMNTKELLENCKMKKSLKWEMQMLSHGKFRNRLKHIGIIRGCNIVEINESYTTRTCTRCGFVNDSSSREILTCKKCMIKIDRDLIGSRNILIKSIQQV